MTTAGLVLWEDLDGTLNQSRLLEKSPFRPRDQQTLIRGMH